MVLAIAVEMELSPVSAESTARLESTDDNLRLSFIWIAHLTKIAGLRMVQDRRYKKVI
jgi:hypothetical protein